MPVLPCDVERELLARVRAGAAADRLLAAGTHRGPQADALRTTSAAGQLAREHVVRANLRIVIEIAVRYRPFAEFDELIAAGVVGLLEAVDAFDLDKGRRLIGIAGLYVTKRIGELVARTGGPVAVTLDLHDLRVAARRVLDAGAGTEDCDAVRDMLAERFRVTRETLDLALDLVDVVADAANVRDPGPGPDDHALRSETSAEIAALLRELTEDERTLLELRFGFRSGSPQTLTAVAAVFDVPVTVVYEAEIRLLAKLATMTAAAPLHVGA
jgi:RNA polymerase primary sigma factor